MLPSINIYFYRAGQPSPRKVVYQWRGCAAVPRTGEIVALGVGSETANWTVREVAWSQPGGHAAPQVVDILADPAN